MSTDVAIITGVPFWMTITELKENLAPYKFYKTITYDSVSQGNKKTLLMILRPKACCQSVLKILNNHPWFKKHNMNAYITDYVPKYTKVPQNIPKGKLTKKNNILPQQIGNTPVYIVPQKPKFPKKNKKGKAKKKINLPPPQIVKNPFHVISITHLEIMTEIQSKFTKLFNLSLKTDHKLLETIAWKIYERLKNIINSNNEALESCFVLSKAYRRIHQHVGDYQLIMQTLHSIQDARGIPRTEVTEAELCTISVQPAVLGDLPYDVVNTITSKYCTKITNAICNYISKINCTPHQIDSKEDAARKQVQQQLKKMLPHLPMLIQQMTKNHFVPPNTPYHRCRMYGEPFLPTRDARDPFLKPSLAVHLRRSERMYNLIKFKVPLTRLAELMRRDGADVGGAKVRIRSSDIPQYKCPEILADMRRNYGNPDEQEEHINYENDDDEQTGDMEGNND